MLHTSIHTFLFMYVGIYLIIYAYLLCMYGIREYDVYLILADLWTTHWWEVKWYLTDGMLPFLYFLVGSHHFISWHWSRRWCIFGAKVTSRTMKTGTQSDVPVIVINLKNYFDLFEIMLSLCVLWTQNVIYVLILRIYDHIPCMYGSKYAAYCAGTKKIKIILRLLFVCQSIISIL